MNNNLIRDNKSRGTVGDFLKTNIKPDTNISVVSAYFTVYAFQRLKDELKSVNKMRFLFGEPTFVNIDSDKYVSRDYKIEDDNLTLNVNETIQQKSISKECAEWIESKVEIKSMVKPNFLHGKMYILNELDYDEKVITGSSNFTVNGLGLGTSSNMELNTIVDSQNLVKELKSWFDDLWNDDTGLVQDVKDEVLKYLSKLYKENSPDFIYHKTLYHLFNNSLKEQEDSNLDIAKTGFFDTEIWNMLYSFQKDGVKGALDKLFKYNGCIIADSVGLGKTFEALAVIRYFELLNKNVLVICPKKLANNWTVYQSSINDTLNPFKSDKFNYTVIYHTDLTRTSGRNDFGIDFNSFNWGNFDLVVIDESHNFKGNPMEKDVNGSIKWNRPKWLLEKILKEGKDTKVLMLSATPVNNNLKDLRNQLKLITKGISSISINENNVEIDNTLKDAQAVFNDWADSDKNPDRKINQLIENLNSTSNFTNLLDRLTIARSRKHVINHYKSEEEIGKFPVRKKPIPIYSPIDLKNRFYTFEQVNDTISEYKLAIFNPSAYVLPEYKTLYDVSKVSNFSQKSRESYLIGMMKVNFLKRLESSIEAFEITMDRTLSKINDLIQKIELFDAKKPVDGEVIDMFSDIDLEFEENDFNEIEDTVGKKLKFKLEHLNLKLWLQDLRSDLDSIEELHNRAKEVRPDRDAKLKELKDIILNKVEYNPNKKIIVFTAFADTAEYLYSNLIDYVKKELKLNIALVTGGKNSTTYGDSDYNQILTNFSPISKNRESSNSKFKDDEISVLIATDCISEGQNLQDCDTIVNYDIHWNPVRLIQRFGRIDRLGSKNDSVQMINFWATDDLEKYLTLKSRVESRMALVDLTATGHDNLLEYQEPKKDNFRDQQLKKLYDDDIEDIEETNDSADLTDFSMEDFRVELLNFMNLNNERFEKSPLGLYAVVPSSKNILFNECGYELTDAISNLIEPGVIYVLRLKEGMETKNKFNVLNPYFLAYVTDYNEVKFNFLQSKNILEIFKSLCLGKTEAFEKLCDMFNQETKDGKNMSHYNQVLKTAISSINDKIKTKTLKQSTNSRDAIIENLGGNKKLFNKFELITWLVIK